MELNTRIESEFQIEDQWSEAWFLHSACVATSNTQIRYVSYCSSPPTNKKGTVSKKELKIYSSG